MEELSEREHITLTKADKDGTVDIVAVKDYLKEVERQLNNTNNYRKHQKDPAETNMKLLTNT